MSSFRVKGQVSLEGELVIPPSKSHTLRALLFALMARGKSRIFNYLASPDTEAMLKAVQQFGAEIIRSEKCIEVRGRGGDLIPPKDVIDAGNSGIVLRFVAALAALLPTYTLITGDYSIRHQRPMTPLLSALEQLGAFAISSRLDGFAPVAIRGPIRFQEARLSGEDSQPVSALLIAASFLPHATKLHVDHPGEKPWIDLTLSWLKRLGISVNHSDYESYRIEGGARYEGFEFEIPGDLSSAAYLIAAALATRSELKLYNIDLNEVQGDKKLIELLIQMGAEIDVEPHQKSLTVKKGGVLKGGIGIDINECIDMITLLPVIASSASAPIKIMNGSIARHKESDRIHAITQELRKMGAQIQEHADGMTVAPAALSGARLESHGDHRVALALAVAAFGAKGESLIENTSCIQKSYPGFLKSLQSVGAEIYG